MNKCSASTLLLFLIALASCYRPHAYYPTEDIPGYKAIYSNDPQLKKIGFIASKEMSSPGKIYAKDNMILQNDIGLGIHVFDASVPSQLKKVGFISIPGNVELSVKGNHLYANSYTDLVVIDLGNWTDLNEIKRVPGAFSQQSEGLRGSFIPMPEKRAFYECVDAGKGTHIGWQKDSLPQEKCFFYNY